MTHPLAAEVISSLNDYVQLLGSCNLCKDLSLDEHGNLFNITLVKPKENDYHREYIKYLICPCGFFKVLSTLDINTIDNVRSIVYSPYYYAIYSKVFLVNCTRIFINIRYDCSCINDCRHFNKHHSFHSSLFSNVMNKIKEIKYINFISADSDITQVMDFQSPKGTNNISLDFSRFIKINKNKLKNYNLFYIFNYLMLGSKSRHLDGLIMNENEIKQVVESRKAKISRDIDMELAKHINKRTDYIKQENDLEEYIKREERNKRIKN